MKSRWLKSVGYLLSLLPQIFFVVGVEVGVPLLSVYFFFLILPVLRYFVGNDLTPPHRNPTGLLRTYLCTVPRIYCVTWAMLLPWAVWFLATKQMLTFDYIGFAFAFWIVSSLNTAIAHELIHSPNRVDKTLGRLLDASVGYFHFTEEHYRHHERTGYYHSSDSARPGTSIYAYALRRYVLSLPVAWQFENARLKRTNGRWYENRLIFYAVTPIAIASVFFYFAGLRGLEVYLFQIIGAAFSVQAITYLQHWGLTEKEVPEMADYGFAWDDGCWMQACVTLNHAHHAQHHLTPKRRYYELAPIKGGLVLPASYPVMFIVALFPPVFTTIMRNKLDDWIERQNVQLWADHGDDCIGLSRAARTFRRRQPSNDNRIDLATGASPSVDKSSSTTRGESSIDG